jgi:hypothetical protein
LTTLTYCAPVATKRLFDQIRAPSTIGSWLRAYAAAGQSDPAGLSVATARRLRRLYDIEAAVLATATMLLGQPAPDVMARGPGLRGQRRPHPVDRAGIQGGGPEVRPSVGTGLGGTVIATGGLGI